MHAPLERRVTPLLYIGVHSLFLSLSSLIVLYGCNLHAICAMSGYIVHVFGIYSGVVAEFINLISSESNEICSKEEKRTIAPEHVLRSLEVCSSTSAGHMRLLRVF